MRGGEIICSLIIITDYFFDIKSQQLEAFLSNQHFQNKSKKYQSIRTIKKQTLVVHQFGIE